MNAAAWRANKLFESEILENPEKYRDDFFLYRSLLEKSNARYLGDLVDTLYQPMFFDERDNSRFSAITSVFGSITRKITIAYLEHEEVRRMFPFPNIAEELIRIDPGYRHPAPMTRIDVFYRGNETAKFCEFNTDGTSGMNETNELDRVFLKTGIAETLKEHFRLSNWELVDTWIACLLSVYREFRGAEPRSIAIIDWEGSGVREEFGAFKSAIEELGITCSICDPRELRYTGATLRYKDIPIDLVYRRAVNFECFEKADEISPLLSALRNGSVCMVGPFRSQIIHNKHIFTVLSNPEIRTLFTAEEQAFLNRHLPFTMVLPRCPKNPAEGTAVRRAIDYAVEHRKDLVLKPADNYAAREVHIGSSLSNTRWQKLLMEKCGEGGFLLQEFIASEERYLYHFRKGAFFKQGYRNVIGLFSYAGSFSGCYPRVSTEAVIASLWNCKILPAINVVEGPA